MTSGIKTVISLFAVLTLFILSSCNCTRPPLVYKPAQFIPDLHDAASISDLIKSSENQLKRLDNMPAEKIVQFGTDSYQAAWLQHSLVHFIDLLKTKSKTELDQYLKKEYRFYQATGLTHSSKREVLFTGYYEPVFAGSLEKKEPYIYPIYNLPGDLVVDNRKGEKQIGRLDNSSFVPYWTRKEIERENRCAGFEIAYLKDPIDVFVLHIQGSGKIRLPDNSLRSVHFAGSNGLEYKSIGKLLVDTEKMELSNVNMESIRQYLDDHPDEQDAIFHHNPRYIFFTLKENRAPKGSGGVPLTAERSIALDNATLPWQAPAFISTRRPIFNKDGEIERYEQFNRFMMAQDTGAAIKGAGRVDIFWGNGPDAEKTASHLKEKGHLFFLVKKKTP